MAVKKVRLLALLLILALLFCLFYLICSKQEQRDQLPVNGKYLDWKTYTYQNIKIIYPPGYPLVDEFDKMAANYIAGLNRNCRFFEIDVPDDTLVIYFYTGYGQGREMTGRMYPFADSVAIHFWLPSFPGPTLMQWLLPRWQNVEPKFAFIKHGLIALLDYSGQNYHKSTLRYLEEGKFIPLRKLAVDTTINSDTERHQSAEAASFVDFISYYFGIQGLEKLYRIQSPFETAVEGIFEIPVDSLEGLWLDFVKERVEALDTTGAIE